MGDLNVFWATPDTRNRRTRAVDWIRARLGRPTSLDRTADKAAAAWSFTPQFPHEPWDPKLVAEMSEALDRRLFAPGDLHENLRALGRVEVPYIELKPATYRFGPFTVLGEQLRHGSWLAKVPGTGHWGWEFGQRLHEGDRLKQVGRLMRGDPRTMLDVMATVQHERDRGVDFHDAILYGLCGSDRAVRFAREALRRRHLTITAGRVHRDWRPDDMMDAIRYAYAAPLTPRDLRIRLGSES